jgi:hypothetical protein
MISLKKIKQHIQPLKKIATHFLKKIDNLEIKIYNPKSRFNQSVFRKHKYECKIYYQGKIIYIEDNSFENMIKRIHLLV